MRKSTIALSGVIAGLLIALLVSPFASRGDA